jgi:hypothetical protein
MLCEIKQTLKAPLYSVSILLWFRTTKQVILLFANRYKKGCLCNQYDYFLGGYCRINEMKWNEMGARGLHSLHVQAFISLCPINTFIILRGLATESSCQKSAYVSNAKFMASLLRVPCKLCCFLSTPDGLTVGRDITHWLSHGYFSSFVSLIRSRKPRLRPEEIRRADHATPLNSQELALTSPTSGVRSVGIVRSRTRATELVRYSTRSGKQRLRP